MLKVERIAMIHGRKYSWWSYLQLQCYPYSSYAPTILARWHSSKWHSTKWPGTVAVKAWVNSARIPEEILFGVPEETPSVTSECITGGTSKRPLLGSPLGNPGGNPSRYLQRNFKRNSWRNLLGNSFGIHSAIPVGILLHRKFGIHPKISSRKISRNFSIYICLDYFKKFYWSSSKIFDGNFHKNLSRYFPKNGSCFYPVSPQRFL